MFSDATFCGNLRNLREILNPAELADERREYCEKSSQSSFSRFAIKTH